MISSGAAVGRVPCERCRVVMLQVNGPGAPTPPRRPNYIPQCARAHTSPRAPPRARAYTCKIFLATITHNFKAYYEYLCFCSLLWGGQLDISRFTVLSQTMPAIEVLPPKSTRTC